MGIWLLSVAAMAVCPDRDAALQGLEAAVIDARVDEALVGLSTLEASFACGGPALASELGRAWRAEAVVHRLEGDPSAERAALEAAARVAPGEWDERYGPALRRAWEAAHGESDDTGWLTTVDLRPGALVLVDGEAVSLPQAMGVGLHLVQAGHTAQDIEYARFVHIIAGQQLALRPVVSAAPTQPVELDTARRPSRAWLLTGITAGGLAIGTGILAWSENRKLALAEDFDTLDAARHRQVVFAGVTSGLSVVAATGLTLHFVTR